MSNSLRPRRLILIQRSVAPLIEPLPPHHTGLSKRARHFCNSAGRQFIASGRFFYRAALSGFKLPRNPLFIHNVRDIVGLYLAGPQSALVLCADEVSQIQALDRTAPLLLPDPIERRTLLCPPRQTRELENAIRSLSHRNKNHIATRLRWRSG